MTIRQKPQEQLQSYFSELLTELDDPNEKDDLDGHGHHIHEQPTETNTVPDDMIVKNTALERSLATDDTPRPTPTPSSRVSNSRSLSPSALNTRQSNTSPVELSRAIQPEPSGNNANTPTQTQTLAYKEEQERLQKLLSSLSPISQTQTQTQTSTIEAPTTQPLENATVAVETAILPSVNKAPIKDQLSRAAIESLSSPFVDEQLLSSDSTVRDSAVSDYAGALLTEESPHQWEVLNSEWFDNGRPSWAQEQFDVLFVTVNNVNLALPLMALDGIHVLNDEPLTPLFAQSDWFMGLHKTHMGNIKTVNTARFLMPERIDNTLDPSEIPAFQYNVAINDSGWGLAVNNIDQPVSISPEDIRWRVNRSSRPWVAGMVKEKMCILLDIPALSELFLTKDKNRQ